MASADLKSFLEDRLRSLDPSIDLSSGSPAQTQFIDPVLTKLGTDPFETDIETFLLDRFAQEFPNVFAGDPSALYDTFIKPCILFLEPFKREIQTIKQNQSMSDPASLSDDDADSLAANVFEERSTGGFAVGTARVFYANPTNLDIQITNRFFTASGLGFFPTNPSFITAEEMVFNRSGSLFYVDVPVKAEKEGTGYNIDEDTLIGVDGLLSPVKVSNPRKFENGSTKLDTPTFIATARQALTERSMVTRRGATARINQVFQTDVRAVQIIGAGDAEMQRDLLVGESPGNAWIQGSVSLYQNVAFVQARILQGLDTDVPVVGDYLFVYLDKFSNSGAWAGLNQSNRFVKFKIEEILLGPVDASSPYQSAYFVRFSGAAPAGVSLPNPITLNGGFIRRGTLSISSLPSIGTLANPVAVADGSVHVFGHTDVYVRPVLQSTSKAVLSGIYDEAPFIERTSLSTTASSNTVSDASFDFEANGVLAGDLLSLESGSDVGTYTIQKVSGTSLYLTSALSASSSVRYKVFKKLRVNIFEPRIPKFPFGSNIANDLSTTISSNLVTLSTNDVLDFGAKVGDILRIKTGVAAGDYTIQGFDSVLGGRGILIDRKVAGTSSQNTYEIFTALQKVERPLVRIKELLILDSAQQSTGITIPPALPVAIIPTCDFSSARVRGASQRRSGYVLPDITAYVDSANIAGPNPASIAGGDTVTTSDQRYSRGYDTANGHYKPVYTDSGATRDYAEFDYRADAQGACSWFVSTSEFTNEAENFPPIDPRPGEVLSIKSGPNTGDYLIKQVVKFKSKKGSNTTWTYFIQIYGSFPVDVFKSLITFLNTAGGAAAVTELPITGAVEWDVFFKNLYNSFGTKLNAAFSGYGVTSPGATALQAMVDSLCQVDYEWGDPARGTLRTYMAEPTVFEQNTAESANPTTFIFTNDSGEKLAYRPDPLRYTKNEIIPARLTGDAQPVDYPRDLDASVSGQSTFTDSSKPTMFKAGILPGDFLSIHEEIFFASVGKAGQGALSTSAGSNIVTQTSSAAASRPFTSDMVGDLLFIEEGPDAQGYRVSKFISSTQIQLDKILSDTTPTVIASSSGQWGYDGFINKVTDTSGLPVDFTTLTGKYLTLYGMDYSYQGSYAIAVGSGSGLAKVTRTGNFPAFPAPGTAYWVVTDAPISAPATVLNGTKLHGLRPYRMYEALPKEIPITGVESSSLSTSRVTWSGGSYSVQDGLKQPYRIYRKNVRRLTSTEIESNQEGPFYFFDTECVSLSPRDAANVSEEEYLTIKAGTYSSLGFVHNVDDSTLTYSTKETGTIDLPLRVLPTGVEDSPENYFLVQGAPLQISYEQAPVVQLVQDFLDSTEDRVTAANMLARHFLPTYVSYEATYSSGSAPSLIAEDIIAYIDTLPVEEPIDVSEVEKRIIQRGGNPETPTKVMVLLHDWGRRMWLEMNDNELGGMETKVPYNGTARISYFIPGPDKSGEESPTPGERIKLTRE